MACKKRKITASKRERIKSNKRVKKIDKAITKFSRSKSRKK